MLWQVKYTGVSNVELKRLLDLNFGDAITQLVLIKQHQVR